MSVSFVTKRSYGQIISCGESRPALTAQQLKERKSFQAAFQAEAKKNYDSFISSDTDNLKVIRSQLSGNSQQVLNKIKNGYNVNRDEWYALTRELKDLNVISDDDFVNANPLSFSPPIGDYDENGNWVDFPPPSEDMERITNPERFLNSPYGQQAPEIDERFGDPLRNLEVWLALREGWLDEIIQQSKLDGTGKYQSSIPLVQKWVKEAKESCEKVSTVVEKLCAL